LRSWSIQLLVLLLIGCAGDASNTVLAPSASPAVGQRYRFSVATPDAEQVLTITAVSEAGLRYSVENFVEGAPAGEQPKPPLELRFVGKAQAKGLKAETLHLAGRDFSCLVEEDGKLRVYTAVENERERFPGVVRISEGNDVVFELRAIEGPAD
jgi:hypothetical protein